MPQMAPLWWTTLFFVFLISFMIMCTINYFLVSYNATEYKTSKKSKTSINWKW
uniref:ATP synthase complex subunit 8 n=2 Tax=Belostomatinae TaxID=280091 RepID=A0A8K1NAZ2_9HEMI|nr:ATP synthase F0 subunit 8 [Diplonychus rusticus]UCU57415.1 ATP synthase F0 subunit 8 [Appasus japonicus]